MWSDACCHVPCKIPLAVRAVAMCANTHKIKVYSVALLGAAVLMRNATSLTGLLLERILWFLKERFNLFL